MTRVNESMAAVPMSEVCPTYVFFGPLQIQSTLDISKSNFIQNYRYLKFIFWFEKIYFEIHVSVV